MEKRTNLTIRMDSVLHSKFRFVSRYEDRTMSGQILYLIRNCVREFEKEHGPITPDELK